VPTKEPYKTVTFQPTVKNHTAMQETQNYFSRRKSFGSLNTNEEVSKREFFHLREWLVPLPAPPDKWLKMTTTSASSLS